MDIEDESQSLFDTDVNDASEEEFDRYRDSQDAAEEIEAYDKCENDVSVAFAGWKRLPCFVHTLQLVVKIFETSPCFKSTLRKVMAIAKKVNKSCKATERLITLAGKKLTKNCVTRWDSTFYMLSHFLEVKDHLIVVLDELEWDSLTPMQWRQISLIVSLLQPYAHHTNITSAENTTTIAMVIPVVKELNLHLAKVNPFN